MAAYRLLTTWLLEAPRETVWDAIYDAESWPEWWRGVGRTEVGDERLWRSAWRSVLPYTLEFEFEIVRNERPNLLVGEARGELAGTASGASTRARWGRPRPGSGASRPPGGG